jgi:hypothetical protein
MTGIVFSRLFYGLLLYYDLLEAVEKCLVSATSGGD